MMEILEMLLPVISTAVCGYIVWLLQEQRKEQVTRNKTYKILLRVQIHHLHDYYIERGSISVRELGELKEIYETYHALGGNGTATAMMSDIEKLKREE